MRQDTNLCSLLYEGGDLKKLTESHASSQPPAAGQQGAGDWVAVAGRSVQAVHGSGRSKEGSGLHAQETADGALVLRILKSKNVMVR